MKTSTNIALPSHRRKYETGFRYCVQLWARNGRFTPSKTTLAKRRFVKKSCNQKKNTYQITVAQSPNVKALSHRAMFTGKLEAINPTACKRITSVKRSDIFLILHVHTLPPKTIMQNLTWIFVFFLKLAACKNKQQIIFILFLKGHSNFPLGTSTCIGKMWIYIKTLQRAPLQKNRAPQQMANGYVEACKLSAEQR